MYRPFVCLLAVLVPAAGLAPPPVSAQTPPPDTAQAARIHGRVLDATGGPIPGARITVRLAVQGSSPMLVLADGHGDFALPVTPGTYSLMAAADGFVASSQRLSIEAGTDRALDIVLRVAGVTEVVNVDAPLKAEAGITSAMKTPTPLRDVPQAMSVVTSELIADRRMSSMADVVRFMPGVGMAQGEGNRDTPILRGNSSTSDFFVDGVRDDMQYFRDVYNLERVEAIKGPNAMIFGRGGAGGVINRVTRQAGWAQQREVAAQFGSWDNRRLTADLGKGFTGTAAARVTAMYEDSGSYRSGVGIERYGIQPSVAFRLDQSTIVRGSYEHFHDERVADRGIPSFKGRPVSTAAGTFFGDPAQSPTNATVNVLAAAVEHDFTGGVNLKNRISYGVYDKFYQNVFPGAVNAAGTTVSISAYNNATDRTNLFNQTDLLVRTATGGIAHTLLIGAELGRQVTDNLRSTGYFTSVGPAVTSVQAPLSAPTISLPVTFRQNATDADNHGVATVAAIYVQDQVALTERVQAVGGVRLDAFDLDFRNNRTGQVLGSRDRLVSPRAGLIVKPIVPLSVYGSYSLTYIPRGGDQLSSLSLTNQSLEPEEFRNYEVGVKWDLAPALGLTAAVYRLDRGNVAIADPSDLTRSILVNAQRTKGLELELCGAITSALNVTAGYAYQDGKITRALGPAVPAGASLAQLPRHSLSFWGRYAVAPRWSAAIGLIHTSDMFAATDNTVRLPAATRIDAGLFFDVNARLRAQVNVDNLLDERYYANAHSNNNITPGAPRAVRFALTTKF